MRTNNMKSTVIAQRLQSAAHWVVGGALFLRAASLEAETFSDLLEGLKEDGKVSLNARARYEYNDLGANSINGYSIRTRLGYTTGEYQGFKAMVEMEDLSFANDNDRPALDVPTTELNQVWFSYQGAKVGRQIYTLDDHRFIGHVGWRQNIQTFDAVTYAVEATEQLKLNFGYLDAVHRVNATSQDLVGLLANGSFQASEAFTLAGFAYLLDFDLPALASSDTFGIRAAGKLAGEAANYGYSLSYARQVDNSGSARDFSVDYWAGEFSVGLGGVTLAAGAEILGGDGQTGFTTPLATVHKFNGFADVFAGNSLGLGGGLAHGLEDLYLSLGFKAGEVPVTLSYHSFSAENGGEHLGGELNLVASYKLNEYVALIAKGADYQTNGAAAVGYGGADKQVFTFEANLSY